MPSMPDDPTRRRSRPRLDPQGPPVAPVQVKLPAADFDKAWAIARQRRESIQDIMRRDLRGELDAAE